MADQQSLAENQDLAAVLGRIPSGLFIITAKDTQGHQTGMLASWVQQAAFDPPAVTLAVQKKRYLNDWLSTCGDVVINLLGESQKQFLGHFSKGFEPGEPAFEGRDITEAGNGVTALTKSLGYLEGRVRNSVDAGDHQIYVIEITAGTAGENLESEKPRVHIRKNGLGY